MFFDHYLAEFFFRLNNLFGTHQKFVFLNRLGYKHRDKADNAMYSWLSY